MRQALLPLLLGTVLVMLSSGAKAQAVYTHAVQEGDTLTSIAQRYYGDPTREAVLREANRMKGPGVNGLVPGSWIFVPMVTFYRVGKDETWKSLAARFFGREARAATLIEANKGSRRVEPDEGAELLVPYPLRHVVGPGETLSKIAKMYMPDSPLSLKRIRRFNAGARIERGQVVLVPLFDLRLAGEGRAEASEAFARASGGGTTKAAQDEVESSLPKLIEQVKKAAFAEAVSLGNRLLGTQSLTSTQVVTIQKELAVAYVALERTDLAEASFRAALALQPNLELDTVRTSPRVLEAFTRAKQTDEP
ncbi:MAG: LysM peptidoglycan-binding domain-containing protein [Deltaproteobacteria bacterium]|nr:LysM peptidoglycan-binding domain-containing protein [Deltaproteobacteria bacterium]